MDSSSIYSQNVATSINKYSEENGKNKKMHFFTLALIEKEYTAKKLRDSLDFQIKSKHY